jgi:predicted ATPase
VSHTTAELAGDALVDVTFLDLGEHRLRDLERPERVLQVCHDDLEREFAPLRSLDAFPSNLPLQTTGFVGREQELVDVASALEDARVVTLTGVGGVGKTRLATQVAADVLPRYRDGAWLCELAPVGEPEAIGEALAAGLGVQPRMGQTLDETVLDFLRSKELLLVLDNCEHLLDSVARLVDRIVHAAARVTVLATSREGLAVSGERMVALPSLDIEGEAVSLFVERAADARSGFALTPENAAAVAQICARLDGIPLAIELAAARVQAMTPAEIAARLDDQFRLLSSGRRTAVERHQTLRRAIDWSYDLLSDDERRVLQRLSVFAGGCTLDAAESVAAGGDIDTLDVLDHLATLVRRSLVVADQLGEQTRYRLLETIRQYAQDRLEESGDTDTVGQRHSAHYRALAEEAGPHLRAADQLAWIARLAPEFDNLRVALAWALDHDDLDLALPLVVAVCVNGIDLGYLALAWAELVAAAPGVDEHPLGPAVLAQAAWSACMGGRLDEATRYEARRVAAEAAQRLAPNPANYQAPATIAMFSGDLATAAEHAYRWIAVAREAESRYETVQGLTMLTAALMEDVPAALRTIEEAVDEARQLGNPSSLSWALTTLGLNLVGVDLERAIDVFEEAVTVGTDSGNQQGVASALGGLAWARAQLGDHRGALPDMVAAAAQQLQIGDHFTIASTLVGIAATLTELDAHERSAILHGAVDEMQGDNRWFGRPAEDRDRSIAASSEALGEARFTELHQRGAAMRADEAVAFAREVTEQLLE